MLLHGGCREQQQPETDVVSNSVERGPLRFTVEAGPREVRVGDQINVTLVVETPEEYMVRFPEEEGFGGEKGSGTFCLKGPSGASHKRFLTPFLRLAAPDPRPAATGLVWQRTFAIEPLLSGPLEIPPLVVKYARQPRGTATRPAFESELVTGPLQLEVLSVLTEADNPAEPRDITGTLLPPKKPLPLWAWALLAGAVLAVLALVFAVGYLIVRRASRPAPPLLPEVWALRALAELQTYDWFERDRVREYYYRLTAIIRSYIERKFGLAAPEMTTEEFLTTLARNRRALPYDTDRLRVFLEACDFVKYAALSPRREDAENVLATARAFVHATAAAPSSVGPPSPTSSAPSSVGPPSPTSSHPPGGQAA